jgi:hypothetical protein
VHRSCKGLARGGDDTPYTFGDLKARVFDSSKTEGEHIRAYKFALARLEADPGRARRDIHVPGPLSDHAIDVDAYVAVYIQGMQEVARLLEDVDARPLT